VVCSRFLVAPAFVQGHQAFSFSPRDRVDPFVAPGAQRLPSVEEQLLASLLRAWLPELLSSPSRW
jgi:hypothetical protein